jgi:hypothetical protein
MARITEVTRPNNPLAAVWLGLIKGTTIAWSANVRQLDVRAVTWSHWESVNESSGINADGSGFRYR